MEGSWNALNKQLLTADKGLGGELATPHQKISMLGTIYMSLRLGWTLCINDLS
jgi:hypothetical protein